MSRFVFHSAAAALLAVSVSACGIDVHGDQAAISREEKLFSVSGKPELDVRTFDGAIQVRAWDRKEVRVEIERRGLDAASAAAIVVNVVQEGNRITVDALNPRGSGRATHFALGPSASVRLTVTAPRTVLLNVHSDDGSLAAEGLGGTLVLDTRDGSIDVKRADGLVKVHSGDGSIRIDDVAGSVEAETSDGAIDLVGRLDEVNLKSGDGSIRVQARDGSQLAANWTISTNDGSIDVRVPAALNADVDAHTGDGHLRIDGIVANESSENRSRHDLRGRLGAGGRLLRVRSGDGSIIISR